MLWKHLILIVPALFSLACASTKIAVDYAPQKAEMTEAKAIACIEPLLRAKAIGWNPGLTKGADENGWYEVELISSTNLGSAIQYRGRKAFHRYNEIKSVTVQRNTVPVFLMILPLEVCVLGIVTPEAFFNYTVVVETTDGQRTFGHPADLWGLTPFWFFDPTGESRKTREIGAAFDFLREKASQPRIK